MKKDKKMENRDFEQEAKSPTMDVTAYRARNLTLRGAVVLARALIARRPEAMTAEMKAAFAALEDRHRSANEVLELVDGEATGTLLPRNTVQVAYAGMASVLDTLAASPAVATATKATHVRKRALGGIGALGRLRPEDAWQAVETVRERLERAPELRKQLETLVSAELVTALLEANAALGEAMGVTEGDTPPESIDYRWVIGSLVLRIDHYAVCVAAAAAPGDWEAVKRAKAALAPILKARSAAARRLAKARGGEVAEGDDDVEDIDDVAADDTDDVDDANDTPVAPAPTGPAPAVNPPDTDDDG